MKGYIFVIAFIKKIKRINNADQFSQPTLIIFTKGANIFGYDCIYIYTHTHIYIYIYMG